MSVNEPEEGGPCPYQDCSGHYGFYYPDDQGCSCFISAPCGRCTSSILICDGCGYEPYDENGVWTAGGFPYIGDVSIWVTDLGIVTDLQPEPEADPAIATCPYCAMPNASHKPSTGAPWLFRLCDGSLARG